VIWNPRGLIALWRFHEVNDVIIRRAMSSDASTLADFAARVFIVTFGPDNRAEDMDAYVTKTYGVEQQRREIEDPRIVTLLVEEGGRLIAFAQLRVAPEEVEIARFYVDPQWHGRGVAKTLMDTCLKAAGNANRIWLAVWEKNPRAIAFYEKYGFRVTGSQVFVLGSDVQTDRVMELQMTMPSARDTHRAG